MILKIQEELFENVSCNTSETVADLGFWKGRALFSKGGAVVNKSHFLRSIQGSINSFFVRFCWEKSKNFSRRGGRSPPAPFSKSAAAQKKSFRTISMPFLTGFL
jgi:hypothetical protein